MLGAMGAHYLSHSNALTDKDLHSFQTGVTYQLFHSIAILGVLGISSQYLKNIPLIITLFLSGIVLFSGSLYLLVFMKLLGFQQQVFIGILTPVGGLLLIAGWITIVFSGIKIKKS